MARPTTLVAPRHGRAGLYSPPNSFAHPVRTFARGWKQRRSANKAHHRPLGLAGSLVRRLAKRCPAALLRYRVGDLVGSGWRFRAGLLSFVLLARLGGTGAVVRPVRDRRGSAVLRAADARRLACARHGRCRRRVACMARDDPAPVCRRSQRRSPARRTKRDLAVFGRRFRTNAPGGIRALDRMRARHSGARRELRAVVASAHALRH